ncbi:hypothetical protein CEXT_547521, partial [Caerostris extrusa]
MFQHITRASIHSSLKCPVPSLIGLKRFPTTRRHWMT